MKNIDKKINEYLELISYYPLCVLVRKIVFKLRSKLSKQKQSCSISFEKNIFSYRNPSFNVDYQAITNAISQVKEQIIQWGQNSCLHIFDLLGSGPVNVIETEGQRVEQLKNEMRQGLGHFSNDDCLESYRPIDWHLDFKSGYRWTPDTWYKNIPVGHLPGVDVKVPWELSRFQHATVLGLANIIDKNNPDWGKEFVLQVTDWIASNPWPYGVNWCCTMDVAIRAVNWLWGWVLLKDHPAFTDDFKSWLTRSLYQHAYHIEHNLEFLQRGFHGNHYLSNLAGLIYIGAFLPNFEESDRWLAFGIQELINEMKHQVYDDGVCFEGSTSYHRLVAEIFFSCTAVILNLTKERRQRLMGYDHTKHRVKPQLLPYEQQEYGLDRDEIFPDWYFAKLERMAEFILDITKNNGKVPQFGDNDSGRLYKFSPIIDNIGEEEFNDHRHILAVAGKLFGRADFLEAGAPYMLDAALLLGRVPFLPVSTKNKQRAALNRERTNQHRFKAGKTEVSSAVTIELNGGTKTAIEVTPLRMFYYPDGGVAIYKNNLYYFAITCAPNGLGGIGAHSHNDKLSFELNVLGKDFIVDGGSYVYTPYPDLRNDFRSTWAHNTVAVKGKEQNKIMPGYLFMLPDRSKATIVEVTEKRFIGFHRGYGFKHTREVMFDHDRIAIMDYLEKQCEAYFILNLHPDVEIQTKANDSIILKNSDVSIRITGENVKHLAIQPGFYSEKYGRRIYNRRLIIPIC